MVVIGSSRMAEEPAAQGNPSPFSVKDDQGPRLSEQIHLDISESGISHSNTNMVIVGFEPQPEVAEFDFRGSYNLSINDKFDFSNFESEIEDKDSLNLRVNNS